MPRRLAGAQLCCYSVNGVGAAAAAFICRPAYDMRGGWMCHTTMCRCDGYIAEYILSNIRFS